MCTWVTCPAGAAQRPQQRASCGRRVPTWSKEHRFDEGGMEDSNDRVPGPHPPAAHIPIGARQALCIEETLLRALNLKGNKEGPICISLGGQRKERAGQRSRPEPRESYPVRHPPPGVPPPTLNIPQSVSFLIWTPSTTLTWLLFCPIF